MATEPRALLIDTGSTTTDIIPIVNHEPNTEERTDWGRLQSGELVYTGAKRTPLCALMGQAPSMAEFFATSEDCYVLLEMLPERRHEIDTADGRPMTKEFAHYRISRMIGSDGELLPRRESLRLALSVFVHQQRLIREAIQQVLRRQGVPPAQVIFSGSGEFLARAAWESLTAIQPEVAGAERISLSEFLGPARAEAACAYALARLLENG
jgi:probable H4MPT-linked C1 transfer pathway protein